MLVLWLVLLMSRPRPLSHLPTRIMLLLLTPRILPRRSWYRGFRQPIFEIPLHPPGAHLAYAEERGGGRGGILVHVQIAFTALFVVVVRRFGRSVVVIVYAANTTNATEVAYRRGRAIPETLRFDTAFEIAETHPLRSRSAGAAHDLDPLLTLAPAALRAAALGRLCLLPVSYLHLLSRGVLPQHLTHRIAVIARALGARRRVPSRARAHPRPTPLLQGVFHPRRGDRGGVSQRRRRAARLSFRRRRRRRGGRGGARGGTGLERRRHGKCGSRGRGGCRRRGRFPFGGGGGSRHAERGRGFDGVRCRHGAVRRSVGGSRRGGRRCRRRWTGIVQ
mmetsp:Transcript_20846/g.43510  ORF Transcript_20846/g.43510 Transcript_20846/m.43510 type:complete len:334 (+) Transcript_20846:3449-4450(+)